jgi:predicted ATPase
MSKIILISGKQGAGKTSLTNELVERLEGKNVFKLKFADVIYEMHDAVLALLRANGIERDVKKDGPLLQLLGTEWGRKTLGPEIWIRCLQARVSKLEHKYPSCTIIIDDCRFENEFDAFPDALRVRLEASEEVRKKRCDSWRPNSDHPSEIGLDKYSKDGKFDLYLDTNNTFIDGCAELVLAQLVKNVWMEKRK